jgi:hypothetical protein
MESLVSTVGAIVAALCAGLLLRAYVDVRKRLLLWSSLCFAGLALSNVLVFIDLEVVPQQVDLYLYRLVIAAVAMLTLIGALVWDSE